MIFLGALLIAGGVRVLSETGSGLPAASDSPKAKRNTAHGRASQTLANDGNGEYVGAAACSRCHAEIYQHFVRTTMGRSITAVTPEVAATLPLSKPVYNPQLDRHYETTLQDHKLYQSEFQLDASGKEVFRDTRPVDWIIGTNASGLGGLIEHDGYLFQAPLSYYPRTGEWNLSPGYQRGDYGFSRLIAPGCIFCHSGRSQPIPGNMGKYANAPFTQLAIGCENCHGPGAAHVEAMGQGESYGKGKDPTIVNPAKLASRMVDDICMSCHQTGDARVFEPGKTYQDFRPGTPLARVMAILMVPATRENPPSPDHAQHYYSMILSKCYRASLGKPAAEQMRCITCHDPHVEPAREEAPAFFNAKCMSCHTAQSCKAPAAARHATLAAATPADNCIGCHMPRHENPMLTHSSITNHRIVLNADEPYPTETFAQTTPELTDVVYLNRDPAGSATPSNLALLGAYAQLKEQYPEYAAAWLRTLRKLETEQPKNAEVQAASGHQALEAGQLDDAEKHLQLAVQLDPAQPAAYADLSVIAEQKGRAEEALTYASRVVALAPFNANSRKVQVLRLINARHYEEAQAAMEKYLQDFPQDDFIRKALEMAKSN